MTNNPTAIDVLLESFGRIPDYLHDVLDGIDPELLVRQPVVDGHPNNSIGWIVWHIGRMADAQLADITGSPEVHADGWAERLGVPYPAATHGYGQTAADVSRFAVTSPDALTGYYDAVHARIVTVLGELEPEDLNRVVDDRWDPPVTALVRLVSVVDDAAQHAGQAAYVKGLLAD